MRILVDMDGVLADFEQGVIDGFRTRYPSLPYIRLEDRTIQHMEKQYPPNHMPLVRGVYMSPGFIRNLEPIRGGKEALDKMYKLEHEVYLCTSPLTMYQNCVLEKFQWAEEHLGKMPDGRDWQMRIILTKDKTLVDADIIIDDSPELNGVQKPSWEHVLYDQPYNRSIEDKRRLTWDNWRDVLGL